MAWESPLLDRHRETETLREALSSVVRNRTGAVVVIEGDPGIGKTRLLRQLRALAVDAGAGVLSARASVLEQSFGFGVVRQLLEQPSAGWNGADSSTAACVRRVLDLAGTGSPDDGGELARLHGLYWLTVDTCREPTVVLIDDAQWCDAESLRFLDYLRMRLEDLPVLLTMVATTGEPVLPEAVKSALADPDTLVVRPSALGSDATRSLLEALLATSVDAAFADACAAVTAGNPFLLTVLAGSVAREGLAPDAGSSARVARLGGEAVQRQIGRRLNRMSPPVRRLAEATAALGGAARTELVADVAGVDLLSAAEDAAELGDWGLVDVEPGPYGRLGYRHPAVAQAILALVPERRRQDLRRRCADALSRRRAEAEQVAAHLLAISPGVDPEAVPRLLRAADAAERRGAPQSALTYLQRCLLEELPSGPCRALLKRAGSLAVHVDLDAAVVLLQQAVDTPDGHDDPDLWAQLGVAHGYLRHPDEAVTAVERALRLLPADDDDRRRRWEASLLVGAVLAPGRRGLAETRIARLRALPRTDGVGARMLDAALALHEAAAADPTGAERAHDALEDGLLLAAANGEGPVVSGWITLIAADDPLALDSLDDAVRHAHEHGSLRAMAAAVTFRSFARLRAGQVVDALDDARQALDHAFGGRVDLDPRFAGAYLAGALIDSGDLAGAEEVLRSIRALDATDAGPRYYAREAAARLRRLQGRPAEALRIALDAGRIWADYGFDNPALGSWRSEAALAAFATGDPGDVAYAVELATEEVHLARRWSSPAAVGRATRVLGLVLGGPTGLDLLAESVQALDGTLPRLEHARSLAAQGAALRRAGRRGDAHATLSRALDSAELCGAATLSAEVATELRTAGFRPRRHRLAGPEALTVSERRVADLAAEGATNRTIAQTLFITTKTVELHLTSVYRKLGVPGRQGLPLALAAG